MKRLFVMIAVAATVAACSESEYFETASVFIVTGYSGVETATRTSFGTPDAEKIPYKWTSGDYIWLGNNKSKPISSDCTLANFQFEGGTAVVGTGHIFYNMTGTNKTAKVLATQTADGNLGNDGDFGYAMLDEFNSFYLSHKTSYVWFNTTTLSEGMPKLACITMTVAEGISIAGERVFDFQSGEWEASVVDGSNSITLNFADGLTLQSSYEGVMAAMVCLPAEVGCTDLTVTYTFADGSTYTETKTPTKDFTTGNTIRISTEIAKEDLTKKPTYELRVLTFEDADARFSPYSLDYAGAEISVWSDLIDTPEYGGPLCYGDYMSCEYTWHDEGNTELAHTFPYNYNAYCFSSGGHAISDYATEDYATYGTYENQMTVYGKGQEYGKTKTGGHNGSKNFCMHFGYKDSSPWNGTEFLPAISFADGKARVIDHMYVNNSAYAINCYINGNGLTANIGEEDWVKIIATGYDADGKETGTAEFYLVNGPERIITEWTKWDLSGLGAVLNMEFNITGSSDNGYGFSQPAYFAYDDIAVQF